jgi:hypothetical protein
MARKTEVKVQASAYASIVAGAVIALLNQATADAALLGALPAWLQFIILTLAPGLITWLSGYVTPSRTSTVSDGYSRNTRIE